MISMPLENFKSLKELEDFNVFGVHILCRSLKPWRVLVNYRHTNIYPTPHKLRLSLTSGSTLQRVLILRMHPSCRE